MPRFHVEQFPGLTLLLFQIVLCQLDSSAIDLEFKMTQLNPVYTDTAVATAKPTVPLAETPEQKSSLATLEVHVDDSLAHASELETKLQQYASTADPSEQTKAELAEIDQRLATVQSDLWNLSTRPHILQERRSLSLRSNRSLLRINSPILPISI